MLEKRIQAIQRTIFIALDYSLSLSLKKKKLKKIIEITNKNKPNEANENFLDLWWLNHSLSRMEKLCVCAY